MAADEATSGRRVTLPTAIAALLGTLAGTVVGGLISLAAVEQNISAEEASNLRSNRQQAYSVFLADANRHTQLIVGGLADDNAIDSAEGAALDESNLGLTRTYAVALLIASEAVSDTLIKLETAASEYEEAARTGGDIGDTTSQVEGAFAAFMDAAGEDLGAAS